MSSRRRSASAGSHARRRRTAASFGCHRFCRADFIDIDAVREALDYVRAHSASFSRDDRIAWTSSCLPASFELRPDPDDGTIAERWERQTKAELQNS
jgi:hypothetical protein